MLPEQALLTAAILLVASLAQGFLGFGFGILAMAALTLSHDLVHAAGVVNLSGLLLTGWMALQLRNRVLWGPCARMLPALAVGVVVGVTALETVDRDAMRVALGVTVVAISIWNLAAPRLREHESWLLDGAMGLLGGLLGGAFNTGGPPLVVHIYRRAEAPESLKATVQVLFVAISTLRLPVALAQGQLDGAVWRDAALAAPIALLGVAIGIRLARLADPERFRRVCWIALALLGVGLLATA